MNNCTLAGCYRIRFDSPVREAAVKQKGNFGQRRECEKEREREKEREGQQGKIVGVGGSGIAYLTE